MKRTFYTFLFAVPILLLLNSCKKPYAPPVTSATNSFLVVEGVINSGADSTIIHIAHTIPLTAPVGTLPPPELNAKVIVESDANATYQLADAGNGYYVSSGLNLSATNKYKLKITTSGNTTYESDFVPVKNAQPIDSVSFQAQNNGLQLNISTHDPSNSSRYYRYDYQETWIIHADYQSFFMVTQTPVLSIVDRDIQHDIYTCWTSDKSTHIILGSTDKLTKDVLANSPVTFIDSHSEKIGTRYSILVKQYALTKEAFEYYQLLSKNTEKLGGIFDPQPSSLTGNIHSTTNPSEQVIGYVTAGSVAQKRFYINKSDLPGNLQYIVKTPYDQCFLDTLLFFDPKTKQDMVDLRIYHGDAIPISSLGLPGHPPIGYVASGGICVDCTLRGTKERPAFWTDQF